MVTPDAMSGTNANARKAAPKIIERRSIFSLQLRIITGANRVFDPIGTVFLRGELLNQRRQ
ncbi:MAG TPA: hypothetical protein VHC00_19490 [Rhizobiaceae bacterium]|nr:hypothetical protein [Rhizobiaceae bacterium]